jgi:hypothetical protein
MLALLAPFPKQEVDAEVSYPHYRIVCRLTKQPI